MSHSPLSLSVRRLRVALAIGLLTGVAATACNQAAESPAAVPDTTYATVDGRTITRDQVDAAFRRLGEASAALADEEALTTKLGLLEDLIVQDLLMAKASELKIDVTATEIDNAVAAARSGLTDEAFRLELNRRGLTQDDMREGIRRDLLAQKVLEQEVSAKVMVTDQEVTSFFEANRPNFNLEEEAYRLAQIIVTPVADPQLNNRTGDDATTPQAAQAKVAMLMERLKSGATFAELAADYSEDPESTPRGGDLGLVPISAIRQAPPPLRDAVLKGVPGNARVVTQEGVHNIVYVVSHEPAGQRDLNTPGVREQIREGLRAQKEQLLRTAYLTQLRGDADVTNYLARRIVQAGGDLPQ